MMRFLRWVDRNLWSIPILVFLAAELALSMWSAATTPVLLAAAPLAARQQVYSSLAGSSSGALDLKHVGNGAVTTLLESSAIASVVGMLVGGAGLALVIVERSRQ